MKLGLIKLFKKEFDICEEARNANLTVQCPVKPGQFTVAHTISLPREIPPAKYAIDVHGYTVDDDDLFCVRIYASFLKYPV